jgi:hypothetical protein
MAPLTRGGVMYIQTIDPAVEPEASGSQRGDIFWTVGAAAVSFGLSPLVAFYLLLVA